MLQIRFAIALHQATPAACCRCRSQYCVARNFNVFTVRSKRWSAAHNTRWQSYACSTHNRICTSRTVHSSAVRLSRRALRGTSKPRYSSTPHLYHAAKCRSYFPILCLLRF